MTNPSSGDLTLYQAYAAELRVHAIMLIWLGYRRLKPTSLAKADEDDITGVLVREINQVAQDPSAPEWVDHYVVREQTRQNVAGKRGKNRPIMDIEVERHHRGPCPRLGFEAKPLGRGKAVGGYLGDKGLGAFFSGYYPNTHGEVGMLGYVQDRTCADWSAKLAQELKSHPGKHRIADTAGLQSCDVEPTMPAFRSSHTDENGRPLLVVHVLLSFVG